MLFSRFWILVLAVAAGMAVAAMALARGMYERDRAQDASAMLGSDRKLLDEFLRREARTRLDDLAPVSSNPPLVTLMESQSRRTDDAPAVIGHAVTDRLRELNRDLGPLRGDVLFAVDPRGVVVGRVGLDEGGVGQNLGGLPLVAQALRGYVRDDVWEISGTAYRMAARPVISQGRYYVGAIVHGMVINQHFVENVAQLVPGASVMFFGPDGLLAAVAPPPEGGARPPPPTATLAEQLHAIQARTDWRTRGYTEALPVTRRDGIAVYAALPGMVGAGGGGFAIGRPLPVMPADFLLHAARPDLARLPWGLILALVLGSTLVGFALVWLEFDTKKNALTLAFKSLTRNGNDRLDPLVLGGFARGIAVVANDGIEEVVKREVERSAGRRRSVGELESLLSAQASAPPSAPMPPPPSLPGLAPLSSPGGQGRAAPPPPPNVRRAPPEDDENPTHIASIPSQVRGATASAPGIPVGDPDEQTHWREVYALFIARRKECNEPTEGLTFEKFTSTLQRHKDALVARTQCRAVRFQVMVSKEGKATLKASPVR